MTCRFCRNKGLIKHVSNANLKSEVGILEDIDNKLISELIKVLNEIHTMDYDYKKVLLACIKAIHECQSKN